MSKIQRFYLFGPSGLSLKFMPRVWPWMRPRVCQKKTPRGPSIYSRGTPLSTQGNLPRGSIHHYTP